MTGSKPGGADPITAMDRTIPEGVGAPFDAVGLARDLLRATRAGALATLDPSGYPLATLVNVATDVDGTPLLLLSGLSVHRRNLAADPRASILLSARGKGDPLAHPRLTVVGDCAVTTEPRARRRFLAKHPKSQLYVDLPDFEFLRLEVRGVHLNGGFARAAGLSPADVLSDVSDAQDIVDTEEGAVAHMNTDHAATVRLYATRLARAADGDWTVTGLDPDGLDLARGDDTVRVAFPYRVTTSAALRKVLKEMADAARESK